MLTETTPIKEYAVWLLVLFIVAFGFRHVKEIISFVLDELYQTFIQNNPVS
jgi:hypothetical protein